MTIAASPARLPLVVILIHALPLWAAVLLYGYTIGLPFFRDDLLLLQLLSRIDGVSQWLGLGAFPFYRPAVFSLWKLLSVTGYPDAALFHGLNVLCFGLTGVLVGWAAARFTNSRAAALIAGVGFILFPFNYEAVVWVSGMFHVLCGLGILVSLWAGLTWLDRPARSWRLVLCWTSAVIGVFSHENGFLLALMVAAIITITTRAPRRWRVVVPLVVIAGSYLALWVLVPRSAGSSPGIGANVLPNAAGLAQGIAYPFTALLSRLAGEQAADSVPLLLVVCALIVIAALAATLRHSRRAGEQALASAVWYAVAVTPSILLLDTPYLLGSPRLMYLASIGASVFWAVVLTTIAMPRRVLRVGSVLLFVLLTVALDTRFLLERRADFVRLGAYSRSLLAAVQDGMTEADNVLLVNAPDGLVPNHSTFPLLSEGSMMMQDDFSYNGFYRVNAHSAASPFDTILVSPHTIRQTGDSFFTPHDLRDDPDALLPAIRTAEHILVTDFDGEHFSALNVGYVEQRAEANPPLAQFPDSGLTLVLASARLLPDHQTIDVTARWTQDAPQAVKLFVHAFCEDTLIAQEDGYPLGDLYPFAAWLPAQSVADHRRFRLPSPLASPDCLTLYAGAYREADTQRLPTRNPVTGEPFANDSILIPLTLD